MSIKTIFLFIPACKYHIEHLPLSPSNTTSFISKLNIPSGLLSKNFTELHLQKEIISTIILLGFPVLRPFYPMHHESAVFFLLFWTTLYCDHITVFVQYNNSSKEQLVSVGLYLEPLCRIRQGVYSERTKTLENTRRHLKIMNKKKSN